ncbi:MAG: hypothetical protein P4L43_01315 [Syntrophobacteraceae bacterium]|nr:hypothetical protein [Syntrophobacteraceae bacterium]
MIGAAYFHGIDGRMRIHVVEAKGSRAKAREIADRLGCCYGITRADANPVTGNVLIAYDSNRVSQGDVLRKLREMGYLGEQELVEPNVLNMTGKASGNSEWGMVLARTALEVALTALIL